MVKKQFYVAPEMEVLELHIENSSLDASTDNSLPDWGDGGDLE